MHITNSALVKLFAGLKVPSWNPPIRPQLVTSFTYLANQSVFLTSLNVAGGSCVLVAGVVVHAEFPSVVDDVEEPVLCPESDVPVLELPDAELRDVPGVVEPVDGPVPDNPPSDGRVVLAFPAAEVAIVLTAGKNIVERLLDVTAPPRCNLALAIPVIVPLRFDLR
jgi:hypothetical protein